MAIRGARRIEAPGKFKLSFGADMALVLEYENLVLEKSITDDIGISIWRSVSILNRTGDCGLAA